jgi:hypothetical protein
MHTQAPRRRLALAVLLAAAALVTAVEARAADAVILGRVSFRNAQGFVAKATKLAERIVPGEGAAFLERAAQFLRDPRVPGIDWTQPLSVVLFSGRSFGQNDPVPVAVVPLADADALRQVAGDAASALGVAQIEIRGRRALLAKHPDALKAITPRRLDLYATYPRIAGDTDAYITLYVARGIQEYQADIDAFAARQAKRFGGKQGVSLFSLLGGAANLIRPLAQFTGKQAERLTLMLRITDDAVELTGRLYAVEGSGLAAFLTDQPADGIGVARYLPKDTLLGAAARVDVAKLRTFADVAARAFRPPGEPAPQDQERALGLLFASQRGEAALAVLGREDPPGTQVVQIARIDDPAKFRAAARDSIDWLIRDSVAALLGGVGVKMKVDYQPNARQHKGVAIDRITVTASLPEGAAPKATAGEEAGPLPALPFALPEIPPQVHELAAFDTFGIATSGDPSGQLLNTLIDRVQGGAGEPHALAGAPEGSHLAFRTSINTALATGAQEVARYIPLVGIMAGGLFKADPGEEPVTGHVRFTRGRAEFALRVPQQPLMALGTRFLLLGRQRGLLVPGGEPDAGPDEGDQF